MYATAPAARAGIGRRSRSTRDGAGSARRERRLDQSLEIDRDVVVRPPQLANRGDERGEPAPARCAIIDDEAAIDHRDEIENLAMLRADQPVDARGWKSAAQSGRDAVSPCTMSPSAPKRTRRNRDKATRSTGVVRRGDVRCSSFDVRAIRETGRARRVRSSDRRRWPCGRRRRGPPPAPAPIRPCNRCPCSAPPAATARSSRSTVCSPKITT